jgi:eukaryotic-like serine/threonine-protein kinase
VNRVPEHLVREELRHILADRRFSASPHLSRFIQFVVEETLAGRTTGLKESILGVDVFGRGPDYDPRLDPIVRVQAAKLRSKLKQYYEQEGRRNPVVVEVPTGGYLPVFCFRGQRKQLEGLHSPPDSILRRWRFAAAAAAVAGILGIWQVHRSSEPPRLRIKQLTFDTGSTTFPAISRSGKLLAFASDRAGKGNLDLWLQYIGSGEPVQLTRHEATDITPDFSPDGTKIVFRSHRDGGGIYTISVSGADERRIAPEGWRPRYSPTGEFVVYQGVSRRHGGDLYVIAAAGGQPRLVSMAGGVVEPTMPVWTPDGKHLLFAGTRGAEHDWWVISARGGIPVPIGLRAALARQGVSMAPSIEPGGWSGNHLVFSLLRDNTRNLWNVPFSTGTWTIGGPPRQITFGAALEGHPHLSGARDIVFTSEVRRTNLWEFPIQDGDGRLSVLPTQLTHDASLVPGGPSYVPRFSTGGGLLAYTSARSGNGDVWLKRLSDGSEAPVAATPWFEDHPLLSPDSSRVAFSRSIGGRSAIYVAEIASPRIKQVCDDCGAPSAWTSDGLGILYIADQRRAVEVASVATGTRTRLIHDAGLQFTHVAASPDGKWLAATADGHRSFLIPFEAGKMGTRDKWEVISRDLSIESMHWSSDGKLLYFFSTADGFRCLMAQRVITATGKISGHAKVVEHFHQNRAPWSTWITLRPKGAIVRLTETLSNIFLATPND